MRHSKLYAFILFSIFGFINQNVFAQSCAETDVTAPTISCPTNVVGLTCSDVLPAGAETVAEFNLIESGVSVAADDCGIETISFNDTPDPSSFSFCAADGPFLVTRTYTVIDSVGLEASCSYTFTFDSDTEAPIFSDLQNISGADLLLCGESVTPEDLETRFGDGFPTIIDNCTGSVLPTDFTSSPELAMGFDPDTDVIINGVTISYSDNIIIHPSGACSGAMQRKFRINRMWTATDACGNSDDFTQAINVVDNSVPPNAMVDAAVLTFYVDTACETTVDASDIEDGSTDNCGPDSDDPSTYDISTSALIRLAGTTNAFVSTLTIVDTDTDFEISSPFPITVELQVADECGNTAVTTKEIMIQDTIVPLITCPAAVTGLTCTDDLPDGADSVTEFIALDGISAVSDNCGIDTITYVDSPDPATFSFCAADGPFVVTRTYTVFDFGGGEATCTQTFTFDADTEAPILTVDNIQANQLLVCEDSKTPEDLEAAFGEGYPTITNNCIGNVTPADFAASTFAVTGFQEDSLYVINGSTISYSDEIAVHPLGACTNLSQRKYRITRTWTALDACGNVSSVSQNINVGDNSTAPIASVTQDVLNYYVDASCESIVEASEIEDGSTDNCGEDSEDPSTYDLSASALIRVAGTMDPFVSSLTLDPTVIDFTVAVPFPITVELQVTDECGNTGLTTKEILVQDTIAATFVCNADMTINLEALQCDSIILFTDPVIADNCAGEVVNRIDNNGLNSGDAFPIGVYEFVYEATDLNGNSTICSFTIEVVEATNESLVCVSNINVSIDETCNGNMTPRMVLLGDNYGCLDNFTILVYDESGSEIPNAFTGADIGKSFTYEVVNGGLSCEGIVNIEDKFPPQIACVSDTITCGELIVFPDPTITENCSGATLTMVNETFQDVDCADPELQQIITREWKAVDAAGNESPICTQTLSIAKFDIGTVQAPADLTLNFECGVTFPMDSEGNPDPITYGSPRLGGQNLFPDQFLVCNLMVTYQDQMLNTSQNTMTIVRTWEAMTWYCGQDSTRTFVQIFNFSDNDGPEIDCPGDMTFATQGIDCTAEVVLPTLDVNDLCADVTNVTVQYEGGFIDANGGFAALPNGTSQVTYRAYDSNGNESSCSFNVSISDQEQPIAVCQQFTTVVLTNQGSSIVNASSFDNGSFDPCGDVTIEVRRMTPTCDPTDAVFGESLTFCCEDVEVEQMVVLRVTDEAGNQNECMVMVDVEDNTSPVIIEGLPNITLSCEFPFNQNDTQQFGTIQTDVDDIEPILLTAELVEFVGPAMDGYAFGNCLSIESDEFSVVNLDDCGAGTVFRIVTVRNSAGKTASIVQRIDFVNPSPFEASDITYPLNLSFANLCDVSETHPDNLPDGFNYPTFLEDGCDQIGFDFEDKITDFSDGAMSCYEIERTWTFADWCQSSGGVFETFEGIQTITVTNTMDPVISGNCENRIENSIDPDCGPVFIELINEATDDCTSDEFLKWSYAIDLFSDGTIDITGTTNVASGTYPVGSHTINWIVLDGCNNDDDCSYNFTLNNLKLPSPKCLDNLTADLTPTDTDGDNMPDVEIVTVTPDYFDAGSSHVCGTPVQLSFSADINDVSRTFDCDDIGAQTIELWVTDVNGNQDFCITSFIVQDNNDVDICTSPLIVNVIGELKTEMDEMIAFGEVTLKGSDAMDITEEDGLYGFMEMPTGGAYTVNPEKDVDDLNGITTLDIILIQKHILGITPFISPYKLIAADVNNSENVNGQDIIQLRKLLLGHYEQFPDNTSWRFVDASYDFIDPNNPWIGDMPETYEIFDIQSDMIIDFRGIKVGDVNNSASPNQLVGEHISIRSGESLELVINQTELEQGESKWIPVYANNLDHMHGFQLGLSFDPEILNITGLRGRAMEMNTSNYTLNSDEASVKMIWTNNRPLGFTADQVLFEIEIEALKNSDLNNAIQVDDAIMRNEAYTSALNIINVELNTRSSQESIDLELSEMSLTQNEPNPWIINSTIVLESPVEGIADFRIMDINGRVVLEKTIDVQVGTNDIVLTRNDIQATGVLYYEVEIANTKMMKKMILID